MRFLCILKGLPGSGKSTYARDLLKKESGRWRRINRDDLRAMLGIHPGSSTRDDEDFVRSIKDDLIRKAFSDGSDVILDDTHLVPQTVKKLYKIAEDWGDVTVIEKGFNTPVAECIRRNSLREGTACVPEKVIYDMARSAGFDKGRTLHDKTTYVPPRNVSSPQSMWQDKNLPRAILCDLDGTLSLLNGRNPFDASTCDKDLPNTPVIECVKAMFAQGVQVIFMSGREDKYREPTEKFISEHVTHYHEAGDYVGFGPGSGWRVIPHQLYMRPTGDMRKDAIVKRELFEAHVAGKYNVLFVLDDRNQVVDNWRDMGLTCFQVAPGAF